MSMSLNAIIEEQMECVSGPQKLGFQTVGDDEQQEWCVCAQQIKETKRILLATAVAMDEPINFLAYRKELVELADQLLEMVDQTKEKWEHFNYHADRDLTTLSKIIGVEELSKQADQYLHWRDRKRIKEKWGF